MQLWCPALMDSASLMLTRTQHLTLVGCIACGAAHRLLAAGPVTRHQAGASPATVLQVQQHCTAEALGQGCSAPNPCPRPLLPVSCPCQRAAVGYLLHPHLQLCPEAWLRVASLPYRKALPSRRISICQNLCWHFFYRQDEARQMHRPGEQKAFAGPPGQTLPMQQSYSSTTLPRNHLLEMQRAGTSMSVSSPPCHMLPPAYKGTSLQQNGSNVQMCHNSSQWLQHILVCRI